MVDKELEENLQKAVDLLVQADTIMNRLFGAIIEYNRNTFFRSFGKTFNPLKDEISKWQDALWKTDLVAPSPSASPSQAPEETK